MELVKQKEQLEQSLFVLISWDGMRSSPFGMSTNNWPIAPAPDDRR
jgi:hypothetical protein